MRKDGDLNSYEEYTKKLYEFLELSKKISKDSFKYMHSMRKEILIFGIMMNNYDFDLFIDFLKNRYLGHTYLILDFPIFLNSQQCIQENEIIEIYFCKYLYKNLRVQKLKSYFRESHFDQLIYKYRLFQGTNDFLKLKDPFTNDMINQLINEKCLRISPYNKNYFQNGKE